MRPTFHPELVNGVFGDPALYVDCMFEKRGLQFDLGDLRLLAPRKLLRISDVFVTHTHMDHFMGLDWFVRVNLGRERSVRLFGPPRFLEQLRGRLSGYTWNLVENYEADFTLIATELHPSGEARTATLRVRSGFQPEAQHVDASDNGVLVADAILRVRYTVLDHRIPCLAFALEEPEHVNVWRNRVLEMGLPVGPWLRELKHAVMRGDPSERPFTVEWRDGDRAIARTLPLGELADRLLRRVPGQKIGYVTDVAGHRGNMDRIVELVGGADLLFIESMYLDEDRTLAAERFHLTTRQAGEIARAAGVKQLVPFHFSPRYRGREPLVLAELAAAFGGPVGTWPAPGRSENRVAEGAYSLP
jgi:ribonuclease Z